MWLREGLCLNLHPRAMCHNDLSHPKCTGTGASGFNALIKVMKVILQPTVYQLISLWGFAILNCVPHPPLDNSCDTGLLSCSFEYAVSSLSIFVHYLTAASSVWAQKGHWILGHLRLNLNPILARKLLTGKKRAKNECHIVQNMRAMVLPVLAWVFPMTELKTRACLQVVNLWGSPREQK